MQRSRTVLSVILLFLLLAAAIPAWATGGGVASTSGDHYGVNWATYPDFTYTITGAPASVCGDLHSFRNGAWLNSPGWICTDASGNASKGPYHWADQPTDLTDDSLYIQWPDGSQTNPIHHVWDKNPYTPWRTSPDGTPPTSWSGEATDTTWGAGFDTRWSQVYSRFLDVNTGLYWSPSAGAYSVPVSAGGGAFTIPGTLSGIPGSHAYWSSSIPAAGVHTHGHTYQWQTCVNSPDNSTCIPVYQFVYP